MNNFDDGFSHFDDFDLAVDANFETDVNAEVNADSDAEADVAAAAATAATAAAAQQTEQNAHSSNANGTVGGGQNLPDVITLNENDDEDSNELELVFEGDIPPAVSLSVESSQALSSALSASLAARSSSSQAASRSVLTRASAATAAAAATATATAAAAACVPGPSSGLRVKNHIIHKRTCYFKSCPKNVYFNSKEHLQEHFAAVHHGQTIICVARPSCIASFNKP